MKPWEETWEAFDIDRIRAYAHGRVREIARFAFKYTGPKDPDLESPRTAGDRVEENAARTKLAAQAPAMARLLMVMREKAQMFGMLDQTEAVLRDAGVIP